MFENIISFFKRFGKNEKENSSVAAKERLHLVLAQDRANISADFLEMMKQEIIDVIKKYIDIDEEAIDVRMTNKPGEDGTVGAPALYANIPIVTIKNEARKLEGTVSKEEKEEESNDDKKVDIQTKENLEPATDTEKDELENTENEVKEPKEEACEQEDEDKKEKQPGKEQKTEDKGISDETNTKKEKNINVKEEKNEKKDS